MESVRNGDSGADSGTGQCRGAPPPGPLGAGDRESRRFQEGGGGGCALRQSFDDRLKPRVRCGVPSVTLYRRPRPSFRTTEIRPPENPRPTPDGAHSGAGGNIGEIASDRERIGSLCPLRKELQSVPTVYEFQFLGIENAAFFKTRRDVRTSPEREIGPEYNLRHADHLPQGGHLD